jgi:hypothetical protein
MNRSKTEILTRVRIKTEPRLPVFLPRAEFRTLWMVIMEPATMPITKKLKNLMG